jgi:hypothetical protein
MWIQKVKSFVSQLESTNVTEPRSLKTIQSAVQFIPRLADLGHSQLALKHAHGILAWTEFASDLSYRRVQAFANAMSQSADVEQNVNSTDPLIKGISLIALGNRCIQTDALAAASHFEQAMLCLAEHPVEQLKAQVWFAIAKPQPLRKALNMWASIQKDAIAAGVRAFNPYLHATISRAQIAGILESHDLAYEQYQFALRVAKQLPLNELTMDCYLRSSEWYLEQGDFQEVLYNLDPLDLSMQIPESQTQCATLRLSAMRALDDINAMQQLLPVAHDCLALGISPDLRGSLVDEMLLCYLNMNEKSKANQLVADVSDLPIHAGDETQAMALDLLREEIALANDAATCG